MVIQVSSKAFAFHPIKEEHHAQQSKFNTEQRCTPRDQRGCEWVGGEGDGHLTTQEQREDFVDHQQAQQRFKGARNSQAQIVTPHQAHAGEECERCGQDGHMDCIIGQHAGGHAAGEVNQNHPRHGDHDGQFNTRNIRQSQADAVGSYSGQSDQDDGEAGAEHQGVKGVGRCVGKPGGAQKRHSQKEQKHHGAVVNIANQEVVFPADIGTLGALFLLFRQRQQFGVELL